MSGSPVGTLTSISPLDEDAPVEIHCGPRDVASGDSRCPELASDERWPQLAGTAADLDALNPYGSVPAAFDAVSRGIAAGLAAHATVVLISVQHQQQLPSALATRDVVGQAKCMLWSAARRKEAVLRSIAVSRTIDSRRIGSMDSVGTVRSWSAEEGWGVIDSPETPGGCWVHYGKVAVRGFRGLNLGQRVEFEWEPGDQDGYHFRATRVWPYGDEPYDRYRRSDPSHPSYRTGLRIDINEHCTRDG